MEKQNISKKHVIWDCGSSLYDSFELKSFERQLDSAILSSSRSMSMPHLSHRRAPPPPPPPENKKPTSSKISRSLHRLIRSFFRPKNNNKNNNNNNSSFSKEGFYVVDDDRSSSELSTIPEVAESDGLSPEIRSLVGRTASDRFTFTAAPRGFNNIGIHCV
ncbi:hypothetical protein ABFS82_05G109400 [Erythranthe guttata]